MGEYTGLAMFLWIVGAPIIGFLIVSILRKPRQADARGAPRRP